MSAQAAKSHSSQPGEDIVLDARRHDVYRIYFKNKYNDKFALYIDTDERPSFHLQASLVEVFDEEIFWYLSKRSPYLVKLTNKPKNFDTKPAGHGLYERKNRFCKRCGKKIFDKQALHLRLFCSKSCASLEHYPKNTNFHESLKGRKKLTRPNCVKCGKPVNYLSSNYCSRLCAGNKLTNRERRRRKNLQCKNCGKKINSIKPAKNGDRKFCSVTCSNQFRAKTR